MKNETSVLSTTEEAKKETVTIYAGYDAEGKKSISVHEGMLQTFYVFEITKEELYRILNTPDVKPLLDYYVD